MVCSSHPRISRGMRRNTRYTLQFRWHFIQTFLRQAGQGLNENVERVRRAHQNDIENILPFLILGFLYMFTNPAYATALLCYRCVSLVSLIILTFNIHSLQNLCRRPDPPHHCLPLRRPPAQQSSRLLRWHLCQHLHGLQDYHNIHVKSQNQKICFSLNQDSQHQPQCLM